jgi:hypothetical protein
MESKREEGARGEEEVRGKERSAGRARGGEERERERENERASGGMRARGTCLAALTSARAVTSRSNTSAWPFSAAMERGVNPSCQARGGCWEGRAGANVARGIGRRARRDPSQSRGGDKAGTRSSSAEEKRERSGHIRPEGTEGKKRQTRIDSE